VAPDYDLSGLGAAQAEVWLYLNVDRIRAEILAGQRRPLLPAPAPAPESVWGCPSNSAGTDDTLDTEASTHAFGDEYFERQGLAARYLSSCWAELRQIAKSGRARIGACLKCLPGMLRAKWLDFPLRPNRAGGLRLKLPVMRQAP
jgi:hypothetical protein